MKQLNDKELSGQKLKLEKELVYKTKELTKQLNLDEVQQKRVYDILLTYAKKNQEAQTHLKKQYAVDKSLNKDEAKAKFNNIEMEISRSINSSFKKVFSKEQWTEYEAILNQEKSAKKRNKLKN